jgi:hypothetical protein
MPDASLVRDVFKAPVPEIVIERAAGGVRVVRRIDRQRIDEVQVGAPVVVVVEHRNAAGHGLDDVFLFRRGVMAERDAGLGGDIAKEHFRRGRLYEDERRGEGRQNRTRHFPEVPGDVECSAASEASSARSLS